MPRGRPRSSPVPEPAEPPISLEEAKRLGLWAIYCVRPGKFACVPARGFVAWASSEELARNACRQFSRDGRFPDGGRHQLDRRSHGSRFNGIRP